MTALARTGSGELQRIAASALLHYRASSPQRAQGALLSSLWEPNSKKCVRLALFICFLIIHLSSLSYRAFLQAALTLTPTEFNVLAPGMHPPLLFHSTS